MKINLRSLRGSFFILKLNIMKKLLFIALLCVSVSLYAQTAQEVETQINQSIQRNQSEFERLQALQQTQFNNRQIALLQRQHASLRNEIIMLQREIEGYINRPATKETINNRMATLQEKMREEQRMLRRIEALRS